MMYVLYGHVQNVSSLLSSLEMTIVVRYCYKYVRARKMTLIVVVVLVLLVLFKIKTRSM